MTSTDRAAKLPAVYKFKKADKGRHVFTGVVLNGAGDQTVTASANKKVRGSKVVAVKAVATDPGTNPNNDPDIAAPKPDQPTCATRATKARCA